MTTFSNWSIRWENRRHESIVKLEYTWEYKSSTTSHTQLNPYSIDVRKANHNTGLTFIINDPPSIRELRAHNVSPTRILYTIDSWSSGWSCNDDWVTVVEWKLSHQTVRASIWSHQIEFTSQITKSLPKFSHVTLQYKIVSTIRLCINTRIILSEQPSIGIVDNQFIVEEHITCFDVLIMRIQSQIRRLTMEGEKIHSRISHPFPLKIREE